MKLKTNVMLENGVLKWTVIHNVSENEYRIIKNYCETLDLEIDEYYIGEEKILEVLSIIR